MSARIDRQPAELDAALERASWILRGARLPLFAGLGADVEGVRAALQLAARTGGVVDHASAEYLTVELRHLSEAGSMTTTVAEARQRGDLIVLAGPNAPAWSLAAGLFDDATPYPWRGGREAVPLATGHSLPAGLDHVPQATSRLASEPSRLLILLGALKARLAGRPIRTLRPEDPGLDVLDMTVELLRGAAFGVVAYHPADFDALGLELLHGLVKDLNRTTRFTTLPAPAPYNAAAAHAVSAWTTGLPLRLSFSRGPAEQDDWLHGTDRLIGAGEVDAVVWIGALGPDLPVWPGKRPVIALVAPGAAAAADVVIEVGVPGLHHDAVLGLTETDGLGFVAASDAQPYPSVAAILGRLDRMLSAGAG